MTTKTKQIMIKSVHEGHKKWFAYLMLSLWNNEIHFTKRLMTEQQYEDHPWQGYIFNLSGVWWWVWSDVFCPDHRWRPNISIDHHQIAHIIILLISNLSKFVTIYNSSNRFIRLWEVTEKEDLSRLGVGGSTNHKYVQCSKAHSVGSRKFHKHGEGLS